MSRIYFDIQENRMLNSRIRTFIYASNLIDMFPSIAAVAAALLHVQSENSTTYQTLIIVVVPLISIGKDKLWERARARERIKAECNTRRRKK